MPPRCRRGPASGDAGGRSERAGSLRPVADPVGLVAAVVLAVVLLAGCGGTPTAGARPPAPSAPSSTSSTSVPSSDPSWARDGAPQLAVGGGPATTLSGVLAPARPGDQWQVVGTRTSADGTGQATVWTSPDASTWTAVALTGPGTSSEAEAVATFNSGTVVVGSVGVGAARRAAVWVSAAPGAAFAQLPDQAAFAGIAPASGSPTTTSPSGAAAPTAAGARMTAVATGAIGVIATGTVAGRQAVWYSTDGRHYVRDDGAERVIDSSSRARVTSLVVSANGVFAAGSIGASGAGGGTDAAIWTSTDGLHWSLEADPGQVFSGQGDHEINGLLAVDRYPGLTFVAVGAVDTGHGWTPASWLSPNGGDWSAPSLSFPESHPPQAGLDVAGVSSPDAAATIATAAPGTTADAVATTATGYVAVGGGAGEALAWTSTDGRGWTPLAFPAAATGAPWHAGLVAADAATTVVGDPDAGQAHLLTAAAPPAASPPAGAPPAPAWSEPTTDAAVWGTPRAEAVPVSLRATSDGLVLVADVATPPQALGPVSRSVVELTSSDGEAWQQVSGSAGFGAGDVVAVAPAVAAPPSPTPPPGASTTSSSVASTTLPPGSSTTSPSTGGATAPSAVAVGSAASSPGSAPLAAAWLSSDDATWQAMATAPGAFGNGQVADIADAVVPLASGRLVAVGTGPSTGVPGGGAPLAWVDDQGGEWQAGVPLDGALALTVATPEAACPSPSGVAAVGQASAGLGRQAVAWASPDGRSWHGATVPATPAGTTSGMAGCTAAGGRLIAFGATASPSGGSEPALWTSPDGRSWTPRKVDAFDRAGSADPSASEPVPALSTLAVDGSDWLGAGGVAAGPSTGIGGGLGLWRSDDSGVTWSRVDTGSATWAPTGTASLDCVAWLGSSAVVAGTVDGRLTVWVEATGD